MNPPSSKRLHNLRRVLLSLCVIATLAGIFYTVELWRGKHAWQKCERELAAQGITFNWSNYTSAPVPDSENFFGVPEMQKWFVGGEQTELYKKMFRPGGLDFSSNRMTVAELMIGLPGTTAPDGWTTLPWNDSASREAAAQLITNTLGPVANTPQSYRDLALMLRRPEDIQPPKIFLQCATKPAVKELEQFFPDRIIVPNALAPNRFLAVEASGKNSYRVTIPKLTAAADYLAWSDQLEPEFTLIRDSLRRPYARMQGDYVEPGKIPIPNFTTVRALAQTLGARAQCHFLLGQPEEALRDLTLLHQICRPIMEENKPMTLVAAMVNVAVRSMDVGIITDGLRAHAWREPQLAALEAQLKPVDVILPIKEAMECERFFVWHHLSSLTPRQCLKFISTDDTIYKSWAAFRNGVAAELLPRGWIYQNTVIGINVENKIIGALDFENQLAYPEKAEEFGRALNALHSHRSAYTFIAAQMIPNYLTVCQRVANAQTQVNQTRIAIALERYHLAHGEYPETINALVPQFLDAIPHDIIGGQPPHYRDTKETFLLYSTGWTTHDQGGTLGKTIAEGDWVFGNNPR